MDNEALVKALREYAKRHCPLDNGSGICGCIDANNAADAIEELQNTYDTVTSVQKHVIESLRNDLDFAIRAEAAAVKACTPRWIPVTERLPETRSSILGQKSSKVIVAFQFDDETQGTDAAHTLNGNWVFEDRITVVNRTVTHWMPLPAPPEEET